MTSIEFISGTKPLPRDKPRLAAAHAQAAMLFGMRAVYLEAGSGAEHPVPPEMVEVVAGSVSIPIIVGGGIDSPQKGFDAARAGAKAVVVGNAVERFGKSFIGEMAAALREVGA